MEQYLIPKYPHTSSEEPVPGSNAGDTNVSILNTAVIAAAENTLESDEEPSIATTEGPTMTMGELAIASVNVDNVSSISRIVGKKDLSQNPDEEPQHPVCKYPATTFGTQQKSFNCL